MGVTRLINLSVKLLIKKLEILSNSPDSQYNS